ncbi:hypothetical protein K504DRAFT_458074 [Pleomassaria siparia CBS 279.74]|uniref:Nineteen complex-related protein 2-domain-containing protein n=1 Tax=Pleomassaria siparia CBS 279.74 TaxID=1314801 RepID=A0A6G1K3X6_9PLEO|nr:hypothetical protein K504DRAFT_458074 [Pleomassaria siparia CBS 279.74]
MKRAGSGRVARKIGAHDEEAEGDTNAAPGGVQSQQPVSVVKRPAFSKGKKKSSLRISFGAGDSNSNDGDESSDSTVVTPKKSKLSRIAIENNAERARSPLVSELPRSQAETDRPSYSKDYIAELRKSTPSAPKDLIPISDSESDTQALDIASKFGSGVTFSDETPSAIPTQAEILEKKARRARLAREQEAYADEEDKPWASDEDDDDDEFRTNRGEISLRPKESLKYAETRLVHEDEDMAEGFDDFVEDGNISLGKKAKREAEKKRRAEMAELIKSAERDSDEDETDDSEEERNDAFAAAQVRAGTYGSKDKQRDERAKTPPRITALPDLSECLERLEVDLKMKEQRREMMIKKLQEIQESKVRLAERKRYVQEQIRKSGEEYEKMREAAGMTPLPQAGNSGPRFIADRGLDSIGSTPTPAAAATLEEDEQDEMEISSEE